MLRLIPIVFYFLLTVQLFGQPIISEAVLPKIGDTILMASDNLPEGIAILGKGADQAWNFMSLQSAFTKKMTVERPPNNRMQASLMTEKRGTKSFFNSDGHSIDLVGFVGADPMNIGIQTTTYFDQPLKTAHFPLKYGDSYTNEGSFYFKVAIEDLPKEVLYTLPITPDSVRYRCTVTQKSEIDAWGTLALPDNTYDVLREKRVEERRYKVDIKVGSLPWQDITDGVDDPKIQNTQFIASYHFYSNETTSKVAEAYLKPNGVNAETVFYMVTDPSSTMRISSGRPDIYAYPNPAINDVRFEFSNLKPSNYSLKIYNILGVVVLKENYRLNGFKTIKLDVSKLRKGTYLYSLSDAKGKTIATRRLMVIRP